MIAPRHWTVAVALGGILLAGCERPPPQVVQRGYRGLQMNEVYNPRTIAMLRAANALPEALPPASADANLPLAGTAYQNVQVLRDLNVAELARLMLAITRWVAPPDKGCAYCHAPDSMASDALYTKVVARRMLQMTRHINSEWKAHVAATGVTCYTCHRGNAVPQQVWYANPGPKHAGGMSSDRDGQNTPSIGGTSLPYDPFSGYLLQAGDIRVESDTPLRAASERTIKQTEWTYSLMIHMSEALGVNCTYCHNSRQFRDWNQSAPARAVAWHGIRMVRDLNGEYLTPLTPTFPPYRKGPLGDVAKVNCATCHQGVYKPLFGNSMLKDYPELAGSVRAAGSEAPPAAEAPAAQMTRN